MATASRAAKGAPLFWLRQHIQHHGDECLIWPFAKIQAGYGTVDWQGKTVLAHRLMCKFRHGPPPYGKPNTAHSCGVSSCINPTHLRWASNEENELDKRQHGTKSAGEKNPARKLTQSEVNEIRARYVPRVMSVRVLAREYGVASSTVHRVVTQETWAADQ